MYFSLYNILFVCAYMCVFIIFALGKLLFKIFSSVYYAYFTRLFKATISEIFLSPL